MSDSRPIGVFDSGIGGLTVLKEIWKALPGESTVYFGDSGRMPYGTKSHDTIVNFSLQITRFLESCDVKLLVIACNSASAHSYEAVKKVAKVPVIEVITPGAKKAVGVTRNRRIGVIATNATVSSSLYKEAIEDQFGRRFGGKEGGLAVFQKACPLFVSLAEEGWWDNEVTDLTAKAYLADLMEADIDTLVLGCTHYPLLAGAIARVVGPSVCLVNAGENVASEVVGILDSGDMRNRSGGKPEFRFYTSDDPVMFEMQAAPFLGGGRPEGTKKVLVEEYGKSERERL